MSEERRVSMLVPVAYNVGFGPFESEPKTYFLTESQARRANARLMALPPIDRLYATGREYPPWNCARVEDIEAVLAEDVQRA